MDTKLPPFVLFGGSKKNPTTPQLTAPKIIPSRTTPSVSANPPPTRYTARLGRFAPLGWGRFAPPPLRTDWGGGGEKIMDPEAREGPKIMAGHSFSSKNSLPSDIMRPSEKEP